MSLRIGTVDLNAQLRGKRVVSDYTGQVRMPLSVMNLDITGADIENSPLVFKTGDRDGTLHPTNRGDVAMPWLGPDATLRLGTMQDDAGPFQGDARVALMQVLDAYAAKGWHPQAACELEFYLCAQDPDLQPATNPRSDEALNTANILSLQELDSFDAFFSTLTSHARAMDLPNLTLTTEGGVAQFEVTLDHGPALRMADDVLLTKELIKGTARNHGMVATFMAKPFADQPGNGLHMHCSVLDNQGHNVFDDGGPTGTALLAQAIGGCMQAFTSSSLIFAPFPNSFERFVPQAHAPTNATWGYDNRTVAVRIPGGGPKARRFEHRVAGGDANPYLLFAAILRAALDGMTVPHTPPAPTHGNAYQQAAPSLAPDYADAIDRLAGLAPLLPQQLIDNLQMTKRQESALFAQLTPHETTKLLRDTA